MIEMRVPGAPQHEVLPCRPGTAKNAELGTVPVLRSGTLCCSAPGTQKAQYFR